MREEHGPGCHRRVRYPLVGRFRDHPGHGRRRRRGRPLHGAVGGARSDVPRGARFGDAAGRVIELLGAGRPRGGDVGRATAPSSTSPTRSPPAAARCASRRPGSCATRRPPPSSISPSSACSFDADRRGRLALGLEGGHSARRVVHAGGAATGRRLIRQLSALVAEDARIEVLEGRRVIEVLTAGGRCAGVRLGDGRTIAELGGGARDRRRRGAVVAHDQSRRGDRRRAAAGVLRRRDAGRPRVHAVSPDRGRARDRSAATSTAPTASS